jgi:glycine cleavage system regulatory protein
LQAKSSVQKSAVRFGGFRGISLAGAGKPAYFRGMHTPFVMSVIGADRPGLVETVASLVAEHGGNWQESRMCRLGGEFAGILRLSIAGERLAALEAAMRGLEAQGLAVSLRPDRGGSEPDEARMLAFEIVGPDRPGIVKQLTAALAALGVNIEEFGSECLSAPMSGEQLFNAHVLIQVPESCDPDTICDIIEKTANELALDVDFDSED